MTVSFYLGADPVSFPIPIWTGVFPTATKNGYFNIVLKDGTPALGTLDFNQPYYVGVKVELDNEMSPRQPLASTPYAMNIPDNAVTSAKLDSGAVTEGKMNLTDVTTGNVSTSAHGFVPKAPNDTTQFLCGNGAWQGMPGYQLYSVQRFLSGAGQTYSVPAGVRALLVECVGGGGGGGGAHQTASACGAGGGGGAGGYVKSWLTSLSPQYTYTVGTGGNGGPTGQNNGITGGPTSFGTLSAGGGIGCEAIVGPTYPANGGLGGTPSGGNIINVRGGAGTTGMILGSSTASKGGLGGQNLYSAQTLPVFMTDGAPGNLYGGGGGGAAAMAGDSDRAGGRGADGIIIVWEYK